MLTLRDFISNTINEVYKGVTENSKIPNIVNGALTLELSIIEGDNSQIYVSDFDNRTGSKLTCNLTLGEIK